MITISFSNPKGGCGKTTSAVSVAAGLVRQGARVLLVDLDSQAGATQWMLDRYGSKGSTIFDVLKSERRLSDITVATAAGFDLAPADLTLTRLDDELARKPNADGRLALALRSAEARYDFCLIDCPPWLGAASLNAFVAADVLAVPIDCKPQALEAVQQLMEYVQSVSRAYERPIPLLALPTFYEPRINISKQIHLAILDMFQTSILSPIHKNTRLPEAYLARQTIFDFDSTCSGAVDYHRVSKEILDDIAPQAAPRRTTRSS